MRGHVRFSVLDDRIGGDADKTVFLLLNVQSHILNMVALSQLSGEGPAVGSKAVAALHRSVGSHRDDVDPRSLHAAVRIGLEARAGIQLEAAAVGINDLPAVKTEVHGVGNRRFGKGKALTGSKLVRASRGGGIRRHGDGQRIRLHRGEDQHQRVDLGIHSRDGGEIGLVKGPILANGSGLQLETLVFRIGTEGEEFDLLGLDGIAPEIGFLHIEALGRRDAQAALHQVCQHNGAGAAAQRHRSGLGILLSQLNGIGFSGQLFGFLLSTDGNGLSLVVRIGQAELVDQSFLPGDCRICIVRPGETAGELKYKDQHQQQAEQHTEVLLHGYHLKRLSDKTFCVGPSVISRARATERFCSSGPGAQ